MNTIHKFDSVWPPYFRAQLGTLPKDQVTIGASSFSAHTKVSHRLEVTGLDHEEAFDLCQSLPAKGMTERAHSVRDEDGTYMVSAPVGQDVLNYLQSRGIATPGREQVKTAVSGMKIEWTNDLALDAISHLGRLRKQLPDGPSELRNQIKDTENLLRRQFEEPKIRNELTASLETTLKMAKDDKNLSAVATDELAGLQGFYDKYAEKDTGRATETPDSQSVQNSPAFMGNMNAAKDELSKAVAALRASGQMEFAKELKAAGAIGPNEVASVITDYKGAELTALAGARLDALETKLGISQKDMAMVR